MKEVILNVAFLIIVVFVTNAQNQVIQLEKGSCELYEMVEMPNNGGVEGKYVRVSLKFTLKDNSIISDLKVLNKGRFVTSKGKKYEPCKMVIPANEQKKNGIVRLLFLIPDKTNVEDLTFVFDITQKEKKSIFQDYKGYAMFQSDREIVYVNEDINAVSYRLFEGMLIITGEGNIRARSFANIYEKTQQRNGNFITYTTNPYFSDKARFVTSVLIKDGIVSIGDEAFRKCFNLTSVNIPASVMNIGSGAFAECNSLISINVDSENPSYTSENGVLYNKDKTKLIHQPVVNKVGNMSENKVNSASDLVLISGKWVCDEGPGNSTALDFKTPTELYLTVYLKKKKTVDRDFKYRIDSKNITFYMHNGNHVCPYHLTPDELKIENYMGKPNLTVTFVKQNE